MKRILCCALFVAACGNSERPPDASVVDLSTRSDGGRDLATSNDGANTVDLLVADAEGCLASTPPTQLYEDACPVGSGGTICFIDHPPTDFF